MRYILTPSHAYDLDKAYIATFEHVEPDGEVLILGINVLDTLSCIGAIKLTVR